MFRLWSLNYRSVEVPESAIAPQSRIKYPETRTGFSCCESREKNRVKQLQTGIRDQGSYTPKHWNIAQFDADFKQTDRL